MPTPREAYTNTVERQGYSGARVRAADFGAGEIIARSVSQFGQQVGQVADDLDETRTIYAQTATKDADAQVALKLQAQVSGYLQLEQKDAVAGKAQVLQDIDGLGSEALGQLKDNRSRTAFKDIFQRRKLAALGAIQEHEADQVKKYRDTTSLARESASAIVAIDAPNDDQMFLNIEEAIKERWSRMPGASEEAKGLEAFNLRSGILAQRAQAITEPVAQEQFRQKYSAMIGPEHEAQLIRANRAGLDDAQAAFHSNGGFPGWRASGKKALPEAPGSPVTHVDENGAEASGIVAVDVPPSNVAGDAAPRRVGAVAPTAVVQGAHYDPTRGIGTITSTAAQHRARGGGTGRVAIDTAAKIGTAIWAPVRGRVVEAPREQQGANGNMVRVDYGDGLVGTYLHLKSPVDYKPGDIIETSQVLGLVGSTGHSTGAHVDYSVTKNGKVVDPGAVAYRGYSGSGTQSELAQYKPDDADTTTLVADVREYSRLMGLSGVQEQRLLRDQMQIVNFNRGLQQDQERQAERTADEWLLGIGDRAFKISDVPGLTRMSPAGQERYRNIQEVRSRPVEPKGGSKQYYAALEQAGANPADFLNIDIETMAIPESEKHALREKKRALQTTDGSPNQSAIDDQEGITSHLNRYMKAEGLIDGTANEPAEIQLREQVRGSVVRAIAVQEKAKGRKLTDLEVDAIVQQKLLKVYAAPGSSKVVGRVFEQTSGTALVNRRDRARAALRQNNRGIPPSEADIDAFLKETGG